MLVPGLVVIDVLPSDQDQTYIKALGAAAARAQAWSEWAQENLDLVADGMGITLSDLFTVEQARDYWTPRAELYNHTLDRLQNPGDANGIGVGNESAVLLYEGIMLGIGMIASGDEVDGICSRIEYIQPGDKHNLMTPAS